MEGKSFTSPDPSENLPSQKRIQWEQKAKEIDEIKDGLGKKIDSGIKETVLVLQLLDVNTSQSCEGHIDWGTGAPWISIGAPNITDLEQHMYEAFTIAHTAEQQEENPPSKDHVSQLYKDAHALRQEVKKKNLVEAAKVLGFLEDFYRDRQVPYDRRLILHVQSSGSSRIESQGAEFQETAPADIKQQKLVEYQEEMHAFTDFLKDKYYSG